MASRPESDSPSDQQLLAVLRALPHGLVVADATGSVTLCNPLAIELLDLPRQFHLTPYPAEALEHYLHSSDRRHDGDVMEFPGGRFVKLTRSSTPAGGNFILIEDVSAQVSQERARVQAESEYRSLFDNSVYGIYRDNLDGTPVRANPALAALNGYASEALHIEAVTKQPRNWYVDPARAEKFARIIKSKGRVKDLVSQVYRHRTGEKLWITESAWYVRDTEGKPIFIEGTLLDATERMANLEAIERQANFDSLTGAANRFRFLRRLDEATRPAMKDCVLFTIDLDHFKEVNDSVGHAAGDIILKDVASRLREIAGETGLVARLGGDEFAILDRGEGALAQSEVKAGRIVKALCQPIAAGGRSITIGASVGVAAFPGHAANAEDLLRKSDLALYEVKSAGRNGYQIYSSELHAVLKRQKHLERELRAAAEAQAFELHYQPIVDSATNRVTGYEALMRWNHPTLGSVPPDVFIPIAERAGLMTRLGAWVIGRACEDLALLPPGLRMGINVSANQFRSPDLFDHIASTVARTGIDPRCLVFEITESVLVSNADVARHLLERLRRLGAQIALDDFGTGYSSLSYLQKFPLTVVKIDRSFAAGMFEQKASRAVIRAIMGIGRDLDFEVIAEGVETKEQIAALAQLGCRFMQGYYFGKARPLSDVVTDLALSQMNVAAPARLPLALAR